MSLTVALLIVNAAVFLVQLVASNSTPAAEIEYTYFALSLAGLKQGFCFYSCQTDKFTEDLENSFLKNSVGDIIGENISEIGVTLISEIGVVLNSETGEFRKLPTVPSSGSSRKLQIGISRGFLIIF